MTGYALLDGLGFMVQSAIKGTPSRRISQVYQRESACILPLQAS